MTRVVLATRNAGKVTELRRILSGVELVGLDEFPSLGEIEETGTTFAENALLKARVVASVTGLPAVADDSGLCVEALGGAPGVRSARWAGEPCDDRANLELVLAQVASVPDDQLGASFVCAAAAVVPGVGERVVEGVMTGRLVRSPRGTNGFGYDPIFVATGQSLTNAELPSAVKDSISHRGRAFRTLAPQLRGLLEGG